MTEDVLRLQALFAAAADLSLELRAEMLSRECAGNPQLLAELESLLEADSRFRGTTAQPIASGLIELIPFLTPQASLIGLRVGPYELRQEIGRGGMGTVYRADRVDGSVEQQVAIKFVRRELLDALTLKRFQLERQMMATLKHPYIARLLDASQLDDGTPYYVMEFVHGLAITDYCEREGLDARGRLTLARKVCDAVAEAHRELIVHRDLKPSNILVDSAGNPKLLDFGIAKPLAPSSGGLDSEKTGTAYRYFSPQYAAPEQLDGATVGVACDVYALGLLLYELLVGRRPFDLTGLSAGQVERLLKEVPPSAPSSALARSGGTRIRVRQLRGDLDGIVMRCLRKSPSERYASVEQLEADLGNYLDGRPVQARGGHGWYRAQKFVLRNKLAVSASLLLTVSMIVGVVAFAWQARIANVRAAELEQVSQFQADMLAQVDPTEAGQLLSKNIKAKFQQVLDAAGMPAAERDEQIAAFAKQWERINATDAARDLIDGAIVKPAVDAIDAKFKDQPLVYASLSQVLAERYLDWGLFDAAQPLQERALVTRRRVLGEDHPDTLSSIHSMGVLLKNQGKLAEAENHLREALEKRRRVLGAEHRDTLITVNELAELLPSRGKTVEAEQLLRQSLESHRRVFGADDRDTLIALNELGFVLRQQGKLAEAEGFFRQSLEGRRRVFGPDHPLTLVALASLAEVLRVQKKFIEAEPYFREDLEKKRRVHGELHSETLKAISAMGVMLFEQGKKAEAEPYYKDALEKTRRLLGPDHTDTLVNTSNFALLLIAQGKTSEAEPYLLDVLERRRRLFGPESREALKTMIQVGTLWERQHRPAEAVKLLAPIELVSRKTFTGGNVFHLAKLLLTLGHARAEMGDFVAAETNLRDAAATFELDPGVTDGDRADCAAAFGVLYSAWDKAEPGKGFGANAAEYARKAHELDPELPPH
jgi:serine/threonine protein kinase/tetratricopeptide (TPR) repeat protein